MREVKVRILEQEVGEGEIYVVTFCRDGRRVGTQWPVDSEAMLKMITDWILHGKRPQ